MNILKCCEYKGIIIYKDKDIRSKPYFFYYDCDQYKSIKEAKSEIDIYFELGHSYANKNGCIDIIPNELVGRQPKRKIHFLSNPTNTILHFERNGR